MTADSPMAMGPGDDWAYSCEVTDIKGVELKRANCDRRWAHCVILPITAWLRGDGRPAMIELQMFEWISRELAGLWSATYYQLLDVNTDQHRGKWAFRFVLEEDAVAFASKYADEIAGGMSV